MMMDENYFGKRGSSRLITEHVNKRAIRIYSVSKRVFLYAISSITIEHCLAIIGEVYKNDLVFHIATILCKR